MVQKKETVKQICYLHSRDISKKIMSLIIIVNDNKLIY